MKTRFILGGLMLLVGMSEQSESAIIQVTDSSGNSDIQVAQGTSLINVFVRLIQDGADAGNTDIAQASINFQVGAGGPVVGQPDIVPITGITFTTTGFGANASIWEAAPGGVNVSPPLNGFPAASQTGRIVNVVTPDTNTQFGPAVRGNVLAVVTLNISALPGGVGDSLGTTNGAGNPAYRLVLNPGFGVSSALRNVGSGETTAIPFTFQNGTLTVSAVPEPGSALFLLGCAAPIAWRMKRRHIRQAEATA